MRSAERVLSHHRSLLRTGAITEGRPTSVVVRTWVRASAVRSHTTVRPICPHVPLKVSGACSQTPSGLACADPIKRSVDPVASWVPQALSLPRNSVGMRIGIPVNRWSTNRSSSLLTIASASPATPISRKTLSLGSRHTVICRVTVNTAPRNKIKAKNVSTSSYFRPYFGLQRDRSPRPPVRRCRPTVGSLVVAACNPTNRRPATSGKIRN